MATGSTKKLTSVGYVDVVLTSQYVTADGLTALVLNQSFPQKVLDVQIKRAWPLETWTGGAIVSIVQWDYDDSIETVSVTLSTTSVQSYGITFRVFYEE